MGWEKNIVQIQFSSYKNTHDIFIEINKTLLKPICNNRTPQIAKEIIGIKDKRYYFPQHQTLLQSNNNKNGMGLE